ncbi:MAG: helix-hairpin-helix domain-containing protein [Leptolyngbyaceae cyanobacterium RM1_406_9]|nr:helix-hairpin-helix domain-containing protein [Leptolyngbyaceae cyanobacterium RM1_406_9]
MPAYRWWFTGKNQNYTTESKTLDSLTAQWQWKEPEDSILHISTALFQFNPNTASITELIELGFAPNLAKRIDNYRNKQGRFRIASDLLKIYGMDTALYKRLIPYISIPASQSKANNENLSVKEESNEIKITQFDVNEADTIQLIRIYGIGSKLSQRIIKYRNQLGGFISISQLQEVYGLDSTVVKELTQYVFISDNFKLSRSPSIQHPKKNYPLIHTLPTL